MQSLKEAGIRLRTAACGGNHTAGIDEEGRLYTWGWGGNLWSGRGALGQGRTGDVKTPQLVGVVADVIKVL